MKNIILADCKPEEIKTFKDGINKASKVQYEIESAISNGGHATILQNLFRYMAYFAFPLKIFLKRREYDSILGWQQFYALNFAFFCRLFHVQKKTKVVAVNFTYKNKYGLIGKIYKWYMTYCCNSNYVDFFHVLSKLYAERCSKELNIPFEKFIVTAFGIPDTVDQITGDNPMGKSYSLSIGRSNRDFDFLVRVWSQPCLKEQTLVILSDVWCPSQKLPENVIWRNDVVGEPSKVWFKHADICITSIDDGNIASGDTVLLTGMMLGKPAVITEPSTLAEMYIQNGKNGLCVPKDESIAAEKIADLLIDAEKSGRLGGGQDKVF